MSGLFVLAGLFGAIEGILHGGEHGGASGADVSDVSEFLRPDGVERTGLDEGFDDLFVDASVDAVAKIEEAFEGSVLFSRCEDGFEGCATDALDAGESETDGPVRNAEDEFGVVDVGGEDFDAVFSCVVDGSDDLVGVVLIAGHEGGVELGGVVTFEIGGLVGDEGVGGGVAFVEAVFGESGDEVKDVAGLFFVDAVFDASLDEDESLLVHLLDFLFSHGAAHDVGAAEGVSGHDLCGLHDLLLVDEDAVCFFEDIFEEGVGVFDVAKFIFAVDELVHHAGAHGARSEEGDGGDHVFEAVRFEATQELGEALGFELEDAGGVSV